MIGSKLVSKGYIDPGDYSDFSIGVNIAPKVDFIGGELALYLHEDLDGDVVFDPARDPQMSTDLGIPVRASISVPNDTELIRE